MSQTCAKCNKVVRAYQRLLVYEPVKDCNKCEKPRPYPSAPPFGTSIKVCSFGEMERMCFPKLCDCPCREIPLCPDARRREMICRAIYWFATFALFAYLFDSGIFRHPVHTTRLTERVKEIIAELYEKEEPTNKEEADGKETKGKDPKGKDAKGSDAKKKDDKGKDGKTEEKKDDKEQMEGRQRDPKREYDKFNKTYNMANVWNAGVILAGDLLITLIKLPKFLFAKTMEAFNGPEEGEAKKDDKAKQLKHESKGEAKKEEPKKEEEKKQEAKKEEPKKKDEKKKEPPKKEEAKKQEAKKEEPKKEEEKAVGASEEQQAEEDEKIAAKA